MTQIERELAEYLFHLSVSIGPRPPGSPANEAAGRYVAAALADWGFTVERHTYRVPGRAYIDHPGDQRQGCGDAIGPSSGALWGVVGRLGLASPDRVQLCASLDSRGGAASDAGAASIAVLMALGRLLAQHRLHHGLELVAFSGAGDPAVCDEGRAGVNGAAAEHIVACLSFDGPGQVSAPDVLSACGASSALVAGVRRLLPRYPRAVWADPQARTSRISSAAAGLPRLCMGGSGPSGGAPDSPPSRTPHRLREAAMLGAEIVAFLQAQTPASCRSVGLAV